MDSIVLTDICECWGDGEKCAHIESFSEAASVVLEKIGHEPGISLEIEGDFKDKCSIQWGEISDSIRGMWADEQEAVEKGACGIACMLVYKLTDYKVIERGVKTSGFDFWLAKKTYSDELDDSLNVFPGDGRLEVSGLLQSSETNTIQSRLKKKQKQIKQSDSMSLPAYIAIVEFASPKALLKNE
ncbi:MAG: hypothetical protein SFU25_04975 [Candidatus Caenarcaniphilales bacterium]|nr:hypothetical protein [Candidatus Caenarcaniphilales bacterium]